MAAPPFSDRNLLYEHLFHLDYPSIRQICSLDKNIYLTCANDPHISDLIRTRRVEYQTDLLENNSRIPNKLKEAIEIGNVEIVKELLKRGYNPNANFNQAIRLASVIGNLPIVNLLLQDQRVDPTAGLMNAIIEGHLPVVNRLLQDPRVDPSTISTFTIKMIIGTKQPLIAIRLLQDPRVKNNFSPDEYQEFSDMLNRSL